MVNTLDIYSHAVPGLHEAATRQFDNVMFDLGRACAPYVGLLKRKGDPPRAGKNLNTAIHILKECRVDERMKEYQEELGRMLETRAAMKYSKCQFQNRKGAVFGLQCGTN